MPCYLLYNTVCKTATPGFLNIIYMLWFVNAVLQFGGRVHRLECSGGLKRNLVCDMCDLQGNNYHYNKKIFCKTYNDINTQKMSTLSTELAPRPIQSTSHNVCVYVVCRSTFVMYFHSHLQKSKVK